MQRTLILSLILAAALPIARAAEPVQQARTSLQEANRQQNDILAILTDLKAAGDRAGSTAELLESLDAVYQMQLAVTRSARAMVASTFGQSAADLSEQDRQTIDQIAVDQRTVRQQFADWLARFTRHAAPADTPEPLRNLADRASQSPADDLMQQVVARIGDNRLSQAADAGQSAADEMARLKQGLEAATSTPDELVARLIQLLEEIIGQEKNVRARVSVGDAGSVDWRLLRREQADLSAKTRILAFPEMAIVPGLRELLTTAHDAMEQAERHIGFRRADESARAIDTAVQALEQAVATAEELGQKEIDLVSPDLGQKKKERPDKPGGMPAGFGAAGAGIDRSAIAQLAADIALVVELRRKQTKLYQELTGKIPATPATKLAAGRQRQYAAELPQLIRRAELYGPLIVPILKDARAAMAASLDRLTADDTKGSIPHQERALDRLAAAEEEMRGFYAMILEALELIAAAPAEGAPHGGAETEEEKAKMSALLTMLREIIRIAQVVKEMHVLLARSQAWAATDPGTIDANVLAETARKQRDLSKTGFDILKELMKLPSDVVASLPEAVLEASQFMEGAANALDEPNFGQAIERQRIALNFLESSWEIMAFSMSTLAAGSESNDTEKRTGKTDDPMKGTGQDTGVAAITGTEKEKPWYWDLPPRAREAVSQSVDAPKPPKYEAIIKRYYERLSDRKKGNP